jgi:lipoprotein-releasing system ATP-binding protein
MSKFVLEARSISKNFHDPVTFRVLNDVSFSVEKGEFLSVTGKSGCGKSTLLYILSTMDTDYEGELLIDGQSMTNLDGKSLALIRNVLKNVMLPGLKLGKHSEAEVESKAMSLLKRLGMAEQANKAANQISGGQKQRVAIARALINDPLIIMGDEPTGNLDSKNSKIVFDIFREIASERNQTILVVTHDEDFARNTDRTIVMDDGRIIS